MMDCRARRKIAVFNAVIVLFAVILIGIFVWGVITGESSFSKAFPRVAVTLASSVVALVRLNSGAGRRLSLDMMEASYKEEIGDAFSDRPALRKKLLCALRLYNESDYSKAMKYLVYLLKRSEGASEYTTVVFFIALCYTDAGVYPDAIHAYKKILEVEPSMAVAHSNLGLLYEGLGEYDRALESFGMSIAYKRDNYYAYTNRAGCYFKMGEDALAREDALRALELKNNGREAAGLLYILCSLAGDVEGKDKYLRIAVGAGASREALDFAVESYRGERGGVPDAEDDEGEEATE